MRMFTLLRMCPKIAENLKPVSNMDVVYLPELDRLADTKPDRFHKTVGERVRMRKFLHSLICASEKAAVIARTCRKEADLFKLLIEEKNWQ